ncbi:hypothetical protein COLO4_08113 [Corchorus olitorius]|uniref:Uncharacterized protein n=1 Tax=Corchorus olitorius TaxID=93759 RepID=A0A1R3KH99_9ROSI|nr:hypothetical protein COLO4_08113 [Corchorus olitorius]
MRASLSFAFSFDRMLCVECREEEKEWEMVFKKMEAPVQEKPSSFLESVWRGRWESKDSCVQLCGKVLAKSLQSIEIGSGRKLVCMCGIVRMGCPCGLINQMFLNDPLYALMCADVDDP